MDYGITIRMAEPEDAEALLEIYRPYVENTAVSFEYEVPSVEEFRGRIEHTLEKYPYLVEEKNGELIGYAYVSPFKTRAAYDWSVETSIYIKKGITGQGYGKRLYLKLEEILKKQHILNMNACIAYTGFHEHLGYGLVGKFHKSGYKFGSWYDMIWMEKMLGEHSERPEAVLPITEIHLS